VTGILLVGGFLLAAFGAVVVAHNVRIHRRRRLVQALSDETYDAILSCIDAFTDAPRNAALFIDTGRPAAAETDEFGGPQLGGAPFVLDADLEPILASPLRLVAQLPVPAWHPDETRRGGCLVLFGSNEALRCLFYPAGSGPRSDRAGLVASEKAAVPLRPLAVPRVLNKSGRSRNLLSPSSLLRKVPTLDGVVSAVGPNPEKTLVTVLAPSSWGESFEAFERIQVGGSPDWVQSPEWPSCPDCGRRAAFLAQIGVAASPALDRRVIGDVTYLFGCETHRESVLCVTQFT